MAKRKRLSPATLVSPQDTPALETKSAPFAAPPPIAQVSAEAATTAALMELSGMVSEARATGRFLEALPLDAVEMHHILRDRMGMYDEEMAVLVASIKARGQTTPIEVTPLPGAPERYGLISGYRRMVALQQLAEIDPETYGTVKAQVVSHTSAQEAYVAMVEENEVRVDLSPYERAHLVVRALDNGLFPDQKEALQTLYENVTRSKRSRIGALIPLVRVLGDAIRHPAHLSERMGLALVKLLSADPVQGPRLAADLRAKGALSHAEETAFLEAALAEVKPVEQASEPTNAPTPRTPFVPTPEPEPIVRPRIPRVDYDPKSGILQVNGADEGMVKAIRDCIRAYALNSHK